MNDTEPPTYGTETIAGEYHGPNVLADVRGVIRTLEVTLSGRMDTVEHAGGDVTKDTACRDLMKAIQAMKVIEEGLENMADADMDRWGE
jgi:arginine utilization protein RocB